MRCWIMTMRTTGGLGTRFFACNRLATGLSSCKHCCLQLHWASVGDLSYLPRPCLPPVTFAPSVSAPLPVACCREHSFEVALFAELFQEMLQQRFGRAILRALEAIDAAKLKRSASRRDGKDDGKEDSKAPGSASKKRERSAEPADGDVEMADAARQPAADAGDSAAAAKRQKTEAATGEHVQAELAFCSSFCDGRLHIRSCILPCTASCFALLTLRLCHACLPAGDGAAASAAAGLSENLLTACRFYDRECAGYLADEDLEEIAYMVSDSLSSEWQ